jgi:peptidoglycan/xylan/chitin deacetylase (PgdA/CDA1 family)
VVVCAIRPREEPFDSCLRALREDGADPVVVISAHDPARADAERVAGSLGVSIVGADGQGVAAIHNTALALCPSATLALLDDDVVVQPGWLEALTAAWARAPYDAAAVGGPLRLRLVGTTPRWWRKEAAEAFAAHDYGDSAMTLDPTRQTMHAGNLSFRRDALRGAEGFWPARGHGRSRDWSSDEHTAQHSLGALGWRSLYEPSATAHRLVYADRASYRAMLARRFRGGSRAAVMEGAHSRDGVARRTWGSAFEVASAPLRFGERRRLMESSAELAHNLGWLLSPVIAARDFEPTGSTPFRPFIAGVRHGRSGGRVTRMRSSLGRGAGPLILVYHRVHPGTVSVVECVSPQHFDQQLAVLRDRAEIVSLATIVAWARGQSAGRVRARDMVAITFDDGYLDNLTYAAPLLTAHSAPATVFVATGHIESQEPFFWDEVEFLLSDSGRPLDPLLALEFGGYRREWLARTVRERCATREIVRRQLQALTPGERTRTLRQLRRWAGPAGGTSEPDRRPMSVAELRTLAAMPMIDVAAHTVHHASLRFQELETQKRELARAREQLDAWLESPSEVGFAYPFGVPGVDFDEHTARLVRDHGYAYAVSNEQGIVTRASDTYALPRLAVPDTDGEAFARWLDDLD